MCDPVSRNDHEWREAAANYVKAKHALQDAQQAEQEAKLTLLELTDVDAKGAGVSVKFIERRGAVDYKRIINEVAPDIDVEPYRKRSSSVASISISSEQE